MGHVVAVCSDTKHSFSKKPTDQIEIVAGIGVRGDAHAGEKVQHLSRVRADPDQPNLRQVHLIQSELFEELAKAGFDIAPGDLGENVATNDIDLLSLDRDTLLRIGDDVVLQVTGLRNPCGQIEAFRPGLLKEVAVKTPRGIVRKAGIMSIALHGGVIAPGDSIEVQMPPGQHIPLELV